MNTYKEHYQYCKNNFNHPEPDVSDLTITEDLQTTSEYYDLINSLNEKATEAFKDKENYHVDQFRNGIKDAMMFPEVQLIHDYFYEQISNNFFGSNFTSNRVQVCKSLPSKADLESSWLWHYDDNGPTHIKLFIYLSDVEFFSDGAFCYAANENNEPLKMKTSKIGPHHRTQQVFPASRVPKDFVDSNGLKENYMLGGKGKCFLFDPNIIHKAIIPDEGRERMALIYHYHPTSNKINLFNYLHASVKDYILR
tara:strand:- start:835 stop:1590 length:756 start_codon:yes stop_codon:yes gene_type:complete